MSGLPEQRKAEIQERLSKATPGPWYWRNTQEPFLFGARSRVVMAFSRMGMQGAQPQFRTADGLLDDTGKANINAYPDADLIAHAPTDIADLLAELDRTTADLAVAAEVARERGQEVERLRKVAEAAAGFCLYAYGNDRSGELAAYDRLTEAIDALNAWREGP